MLNVNGFKKKLPVQKSSIGHNYIFMYSQKKKNEQKKNKQKENKKEKGKKRKHENKKRKEEENKNELKKTQNGPAHVGG